MDKINKKKFIEAFHEAYINKHINTNLHCHKAVYDTLKTMSDGKTAADKALLDSYERIKHLIIDNDFDTMDDIMGSWKNNVYSQDPKHMICHEEIAALKSVKSSLSPEAYNMLSLFTSNVSRRQDYSFSLTCAKQILSFKPKQFAAEACAVDVLMNVLVYLSKCEKGDSKVNGYLYKYIIISRELLYFKSTQKTIKRRSIDSKIVPLILFLWFHREQIDMRRPMISLPKEKYLYVICDKNDEIRHEIEKDIITQNKQARGKIKNVKALLPTPAGGKIDIVKIYQYN